MEIRSRVAIIIRKYTKQGSDGVVLSLSSYEDCIIFSHDVKCDDNLIGHDNMTFAQLAMLPIIQNWNDIKPELQKVVNPDIAFIQVMSKGSSYLQPIPKDYYYNAPMGIFSRVIAKAAGNTYKSPSLTEECLSEWGINKLGYFLFRINVYNNPDLISDVESSKLEYCFMSDNLKTEVLTKAWLEYLDAVLRNVENPFIYTTAIPNEFVDVSAQFCLRRGYDKLVYMFLQEHPLRISKHVLDEITRWHNSKG